MASQRKEGSNVGARWVQEVVRQALQIPEGTEASLLEQTANSLWWGDAEPRQGTVSTSKVRTFEDPPPRMQLDSIDQLWRKEASGPPQPSTEEQRSDRLTALYNSFTLYNTLSTSEMLTQTEVRQHFEQGIIQIQEPYLLTLFFPVHLVEVEQDLKRAHRVDLCCQMPSNRREPDSTRLLDPNDCNIAYHGKLHLHTYSVAKEEQGEGNSGQRMRPSIILQQNDPGDIKICKAERADSVTQRQVTNTYQDMIGILTGNGNESPISSSILPKAAEEGHSGYLGAAATRDFCCRILVLLNLWFTRKDMDKDQSWFQLMEQLSNKIGNKTAPDRDGVCGVFGSVPLWRIRLRCRLLFQALTGGCLCLTSIDGGHRIMRLVYNDLPVSLTPHGINIPPSPQPEETEVHIHVMRMGRMHQGLTEMVLLCLSTALQREVSKSKAVDLRDHCKEVVRALSGNDIMGPSIPPQLSKLAGEYLCFDPTISKIKATISGSQRAKAYLHDIFLDGDGKVQQENQGKEKQSGDTKPTRANIIRLDRLSRKTYLYDALKGCWEADGIYRELHTSDDERLFANTFREGLAVRQRPYVGQRRSDAADLEAVIDLLVMSIHNLYSLRVLYCVLQDARTGLIPHGLRNVTGMCGYLNTAFRGFRMLFGKTYTSDPAMEQQRVRIFKLGRKGRSGGALGKKALEHYFDLAAGSALMKCYKQFGVYVQLQPTGSPLSADLFNCREWHYNKSEDTDLSDLLSNPKGELMNLPLLLLAVAGLVVDSLVAQKNKVGWDQPVFIECPPGYKQTDGLQHLEPRWNFLEGQLGRLSKDRAGLGLLDLLSLSVNTTEYLMREKVASSYDAAVLVEELEVIFNRVLRLGSDEQQAKARLTTLIGLVGEGKDPFQEVAPPQEIVHLDEDTLSKSPVEVHMEETEEPPAESDNGSQESQGESKEVATEEEEDESDNGSQESQGESKEVATEEEEEPPAEPDEQQDHSEESQGESLEDSDYALSGVEDCSLDPSFFEEEATTKQALNSLFDEEAAASQHDEPSLQITEESSTRETREEMEKMEIIESTQTVVNTSQREVAFRIMASSLCKSTLAKTTAEKMMGKEFLLKQMIVFTPIDLRQQEKIWGYNKKKHHRKIEDHLRCLRDNQAKIEGLSAFCQELELLLGKTLGQPVTDALGSGELFISKITMLAGGTVPQLLHADFDTSRKFDASVRPGTVIIPVQERPVSLRIMMNGEMIEPFDFGWGTVLWLDGALFHAGLTGSGARLHVEVDHWSTSSVLHRPVVRKFTQQDLACLEVGSRQNRWLQMEALAWEFYSQAVDIHKDLDIGPRSMATIGIIPATQLQGIVELRRCMPRDLDKIKKNKIFNFGTRRGGGKITQVSGFVSAKLMDSNGETMGGIPEQTKAALLAIINCVTRVLPHRAGYDYTVKVLMTVCEEEQPPHCDIRPHLMFMKEGSHDCSTYPYSVHIPMTYLAKTKRGGTILDVWSERDKGVRTLVESDSLQKKYVSNQIRVPFGSFFVARNDMVHAGVYDVGNARLFIQLTPKGPRKECASLDSERELEKIYTVHGNDLANFVRVRRRESLLSIETNHKEFREKLTEIRSQLDADWRDATSHMLVGQSDVEETNQERKRKRKEE